MKFTITMARRRDGAKPTMGTFTYLHPAGPGRGACDAPLPVIDVIAASRLRAFVIVSLL
jgi:hypothetical protein